MRTYAGIIGLLILRMVESCLAGPTAAGCLEVAVDRDAIFAPGPLRLTAALSERARLAGAYKIKVGVYLAGLAIREQTCPIDWSSPVTWTWPFPEVRERTEVRCRIELSLEGEFLEAAEVPVSVWPLRVRITTGDPLRDVWVLDASGELQRIFREMDVRVEDAAFQAIRDFGVPSCVFIGEYASGPSVQQLIDRLSREERPPGIVFLRQSRFVEELGVRLAGESASNPVAWDMNTPLLANLSRRDVMALVRGADGLAIEPTPGRVTRSLLTRPFREGDSVRTYLALVTEARHRTVYCQLPVLDPCNPRQATLLHNVIRFAAAEVAVADRRHLSSEERRTP